MKQFIILALTLLSISCSKKTPEEKVHRILSDRLSTLTIAEGCTGGILSTRFTANPGASAFFKGSIVAYNIELMRNLLNVQPATIGLHGEVSEAVAREMAEGIRELTQATYAIATTGTAGPTGGTPENPVGTVWIAIATPDSTVTKRFFGGKGRTDIIDKASTAAIELLLEQLQ